jgi:hypothetical protein
MPLVAPIRDAVVGILNGAGLAPALAALAIYDIVFSLQDLAQGGGRLVVCPTTKEPTLLTRGGPQRSMVRIDVAVQYKFNQPTAAELDPYLNLAEAIPALFIGKMLDISGGRSVGCTEVAYPHGLFLQAHIEQFRVFTSTITLSFLCSD